MFRRQVAANYGRRDARRYAAGGREASWTATALWRLAVTMQ